MNTLLRVQRLAASVQTDFAPATTRLPSQGRARRRAVVRRFDPSDADSFVRFICEDPSYRKATISGRQFNVTDAYNLFCRVVGHYHLKPYGWLGAFDAKTNGVIGVIGAMFDQSSLNAEFVVVVTARRRYFGLSRQVIIDYYKSKEWANIDESTFALVASDNRECINFLSRLGFLKIKEFHHAEGADTGYWKVDWSSVEERAKGRYAVSGRDERRGNVRDLHASRDGRRACG
jgi:hypothetical protein